MNLHEYQAKQLLAQHGVAVPQGQPCTSSSDARAAAQAIFSAGHRAAVVKSQIHAGGRGKGVFKDGYKGGVKLAGSVDETVSFAERMLGNVLITKQTGPEGQS